MEEVIILQQRKYNGRKATPTMRTETELQKLPPLARFAIGMIKKID